MKADYDLYFLLVKHSYTQNAPILGFWVCVDTVPAVGTVFPACPQSYQPFPEALAPFSHTGGLNAPLLVSLKHVHTPY